MNYPIYRKDLQTYRTEYYRVEAEEYIGEIVDTISKNIISTCVESTAQNITYTISDILAFSNIYPRGITQDNIINNIKHDLKQRFPDTEIVIDKMKTRIYINWS